MAYHLHVVERPDATLADQLAALQRLAPQVERLPLSERKAAQVHGLDAAPWSAVVLRDDDAHARAALHLRWEDDGDLAASSEVLVGDAAAADLDRLLVAARELVASAGGGTWQVWAHDVDGLGAPMAAASERAGLALARRLLLMRRPLGGVPPAALPEDVVVRPLREGLDDEALIAVNNAAFAGHPEQGGWTVHDLTVRRATSWYDPADVLLAWRGDELVGFHWTKRHPRGEAPAPAAEPVGEVYVLAVAPSAQGSGLGRALLRCGLVHLAARGCADAVLFVDAAEPAAGLYADEGFAVVREDRCYAVAVPAADRSASSASAADG